MAPAPKAPAHRLGCATLTHTTPLTRPPNPGRSVRACWRPSSVRWCAGDRDRAGDGARASADLHLRWSRAAGTSRLIYDIQLPSSSAQHTSSAQQPAACTLARQPARGRESCFGFPFNTSPSAATRGLRMTDHPYLSAPQPCTPRPPATSRLHKAHASGEETKLPLPKPRDG